MKNELFPVDLALTVPQTSDKTYPMRLMNSEPKNIHVEDKDTISIYDNHHLLLKAFDICIVFYF